MTLAFGPSTSRTPSSLVLFCRAFIISRTGQILRRACQTCTRQSWVEAKALLMLQGKGKYDQILTIFSTGWNTWLRLVSDVAFFVPLFDAAQIPWLSKSPKVFSKPGLILGPVLSRWRSWGSLSSDGSAVKEPVGHFTHFTCDIGRSRHVTTYSQPIRNLFALLCTWT